MCVILLFTLLICVYMYVYCCDLIRYHFPPPALNYVMCPKIFTLFTQLFFGIRNFSRLKKL